MLLPERMQSNVSKARSAPDVPDRTERRSSAPAAQLWRAMKLLAPRLYVLPLPPVTMSW